MTNISRSWLWVASMLALAASSCEEEAPAAKVGELGALSFDYACNSPSDAFCDGATPAFEAGEIPSVAVGGRMSMLSPAGPIAVPLTSTDATGAPNRAGFATFGDRYCASPSGESACAGGGESYFVHDIVHVNVVAPAELKVFHAAAATVYSQEVGVDAFDFNFPEDTFRAVLFDAEGNMLAGGAPCTWTTSDPNVVEILSDPAANIVRFRIGDPGQAELSVQLGGFEQSIAFDIE